MMTAEVVQLAPAGRPRDWPMLIPRELLTHHQPLIGAGATLIWLNMYEIADGGARTEFSTVQAVLATRLGMGEDEVAAGLQTLQQAGLLQQHGGRWIVLWPAQPDAAARDGHGTPGETSHLPSALPEPEGAPTFGGHGSLPGEPGDPATTADGGEPTDVAGWNSDEAALQAVVQFYHQRIGMLGPSQFEKLRFWVEEQQMASDVVALAIEETVQNAQTPRIAYVEGVLRNWYNEGIRTVADLQNSKRTRSHEVAATTEGTPNAAAFDAVDKDALRSWKEMYADEYDD